MLDPEAQAGADHPARELGATHVWTGFTPPPLVAELIARWIALARRGIESAGWSRTTFPETATDPWSWLSDYLGEPARLTDAQPAPPRWARPALDEMMDAPTRCSCSPLPLEDND